MEKDIIENNKLIAEFMGHKFRKMHEDLIPYSYRDELCCNIPEMHGAHGWDNDCFFETQLRYHGDWNWLMKVVERIEGLNCNILIRNFVGELTSSESEKHSCVIVYFYYKEDEKCEKMFITDNEKNKIMSIYENCIKFIKWYNQNIKTED